MTAKLDWPGIRAICFDAGDTLVLDRPSMQERIETALARRGVEYNANDLAPAVQEMVAYSLNRYLRGASLDDPELIASSARALLTGLGVENAETDVLRGLVQAYASIPYERYLAPGAIALLTALRERGFKIAVISDWEPDLADLLRRLGCNHLLDCVSISTLVGANKPDPRLFQDALSRLGVAPSQAVHVGDYLELDIAGASSAGMRAILFDWKRRYKDAQWGVPVARNFETLADQLLSLPAPN